jgi:hypothetical protein
MVVFFLFLALWALAVLFLLAAGPLASQAVLSALTSPAFWGFYVSFLVCLVPGFCTWVISRDAAAAARDAAAAAQRKIDLEALAARDAAAAAQRKIDVEALGARDAAAAPQRKIDVEAETAQRLARDTAAAAFEARIEASLSSYFKATTHQVRSLAAGLANVRANSASAAAPAFSWSAADVRAWFANHPKWRQYEQHFAEYDGEALFELTQESQLAERGVLPPHTAPLLADLLALV